MKFEEIIKSMSGHEMKAEEINRNAKYAKETFGLTDEAEDALKMLFLVTSKEFQDYIFESTYKIKDNIKMWFYRLNGGLKDD